WRSSGQARAIVTLRERDRQKPFILLDGAIGGVRLRSMPSQKSDRFTQYASYTDGLSTVTFAVLTEQTKIHLHIDGRDAVFEDITYAPAEPKNIAGDG